METYDFEEERLAELIAALPPAPPAWVEAAQQLPAARRAMNDIVARAEVDDAFRAAVVNDLERALRDAGHEPSPATVESLRSRLGS